MFSIKQPFSLNIIHWRSNWNKIPCMIPNKGIKFSFYVFSPVMVRTLLFICMWNNWRGELDTNTKLLGVEIFYFRECDHGMSWMVAKSEEVGWVKLSALWEGLSLGNYEGILEDCAAEGSGINKAFVWDHLGIDQWLMTWMMVVVEY